MKILDTFFVYYTNYISRSMSRQKVVFSFSLLGLLLLGGCAVPLTYYHPLPTHMPKPRSIRGEESFAGLRVGGGRVEAKTDLFQGVTYAEGISLSPYAGYRYQGSVGFFQAYGWLSFGDYTLKSENATQTKKVSTGLLHMGIMGALAPSIGGVFRPMVGLASGIGYESSWVKSMILTTSLFLGFEVSFSSSFGVGLVGYGGFPTGLSMNIRIGNVEAYIGGYGREGEGFILFGGSYSFSYKE